MRVPWLATVLLLFRRALAVNITIDDQNGDPTNGQKFIYDPPEAWAANAIGGCGTCVRPNSSTARTFTGSLFTHKHHSPSPPTAAVNFTGVFVSVVCILSNSLDGPSGQSDMSFSIDGTLTGTFPYIPTGTGDFESRTVFNSQLLSPGEHTLVISNGLANEQSSLVILDSVIYSTDDLDLPLSPVSTSSLVTPTLVAPSFPSSATSSPESATPSSPESAVKKSNNAAIIGGVIAALAVLLLLLLAFVYIRRRRSQHRSNVPLSTTLLSPLSGIRGFWSARESQPPPDIVPFPTPAHPVPRPPASTPRPRRPAPPAPSSGSLSRISRISFNPNLLVGRMRRQQPAPRVPTEPPALRATSASPVPPPSANPLLRHISAQSDAPDRVATIHAWQQRTLEETAGQQPVVHPLEMSEVDLSSHYDESSVSSPQPPPPVALVSRPPQPQPQRRFTVMNN